MLKKLLAIASAATCCLGNPAMATPREYNTYQDITEKLNSIGVTTMVQNLCHPNGGVRGSYNSYTNVVCITAETNNSDALLEVVLHETIHVIQDCISGGIQDGTMGSVTRYLSNGDRGQEKLMDNALLQDLQRRGLLDHAIQAAGGLDHQGAFIEIEAYAFQNDPEAVFNLLNQCNSK